MPKNLVSLLRLGIRQQVRLLIPSGGITHEELRDSSPRPPGWGARRDVMRREGGSIAECLDTPIDNILMTGPILLVLGFNELAFDARIS